MVVTLCSEWMSSMNKIRSSARLPQLNIFVMHSQSLLSDWSRIDSILMFKNSDRVIIHRSQYTNCTGMGFQGILDGHLRLLRMLLEPPGKSEMFSGRIFPRYRTASHSHLQENRVLSSRTAISLVCVQMMLLTRQIANIKDIFNVRNLVNSPHWIYSICCSTVPSKSILFFG